MRTSFSACFKMSLEMVLDAAGKPLDDFPGSDTFPRAVVDIVRTTDDGRVKMLADNKETFKNCFHCLCCK